ncbi:MAG: hypothetical protein HDR06_01495 [Lachnospiraceae bacterium]|nr:hypothetical protein [Lachnospiraceae bacterium]
MKKKFLTIILTVSVSASALAGCGNAAEPANSSSIVNEKSTVAGTDSYTSSQEDSHSMAESSEDVAVDDKPAQGSIGESGLPYYELGFSPEDFTIYGFSVYSGMTADEMYDVIDLPDDLDFSNSGNDGWSKYKTNSDTLTFALHTPEEAGGFVHYATDGSGTSIQIFHWEGLTIADADFIQCPIIPWKTTLTEAIEALGIRDLLEAMGIQATSFEASDIFEFESQFSEKSYCHTSWWDGSNQGSIEVFWYDEKGQKVSFDIDFINDVISCVTIRLV